MNPIAIPSSPPWTHVLPDIAPMIQRVRARHLKRESAIILCPTVIDRSHNSLDVNPPLRSQKISQTRVNEAPSSALVMTRLLLHLTGNHLLFDDPTANMLLPIPMIASLVERLAANSLSCRVLFFFGAATM